MLVGSSAHYGVGGSARISANDRESNKYTCFLIVVLVLSLMMVAMMEHNPKVRPDYDTSNYTCPTPSFFRSSSEDAGSFATKRSVGSWEATVELGGRDADSDFLSSGYKFVVPVSWRIDRLGHDFYLLDDNDDLVASVIVDALTKGWSFAIYDCGAQLLASVEQQSWTRAGLELDIRDNIGNLAATTSYELHPISGDRMNVHAVGDQQDTVLSTITHDRSLSGKEWNIFMNSVEGDAGPGGDERVLAAIASYMTWKDLDKGKGSFSGVSVYFIVPLELAIVFGVLKLFQNCVVRCREGKVRSRTDAASTKQHCKTNNYQDSSDNAWKVVRNPLRVSELQRPLSNELPVPDSINSPKVVDDV